MKSLNSLVMRLSIFFVVILVVVAGGWMWWNDAVSAVDPSDPESILFVIERGEGVRSIAGKLAQGGLIKSPLSFYILVKRMGIEREIQAGDYRLNRTMDSREIAEELTHGILDVWVTTLEGWRVEEIATKLVKDLDIPEQEFLKYAREGYMFPDTYLIPRDATPAGVAQIFEKTFESKIDAQLRRDIHITDLSLDEVIILASIVEREGRTDEDRPVIAGILRKRLAEGWPLQADATLQYALGYQPEEKIWWKQGITEEEKALQSPYNTYLHLGLPPAPISNPGLSAIRAVVYPVETEYWYYLHDPSGRVHYAQTLEEHSANIAAYLQ